MHGSPLDYFTSMNRPLTHFLHIGKTGGSAVKAALQPFAVSHCLKLHPHKTLLRDVPETENVVFMVRDPVKRFVSGFNSRLRQGKPRYDVPWSEGERIAFEKFQTPNALAEALSSETASEKQAAQSAIRDIQHLQSPFANWLENEAYLRMRVAKILHIGFQETLQEDFDHIKRLLDLPEEIKLPADPVAAHVTPPGFDTELSERGARNITERYAEDIRLYAVLRGLRASLMMRPAVVSSTRLRD